MPKCAPNPPKPKPKKLKPQPELPLVNTQDNGRNAKPCKSKLGTHLPQNRQVLPELPTKKTAMIKTPAVKSKKAVPKVVEGIQPVPKPVKPPKKAKVLKPRASLPMDGVQVEQEPKKRERKTRSPLRKKVTFVSDASACDEKAVKPKKMTLKKKKFVRKNSPFPFEALAFQAPRGGAGFLASSGEICHVNAVHCRLGRQKIAVIPYVASDEYVVYAPLRRRKNFIMRRQRSRSAPKT